MTHTNTKARRIRRMSATAAMAAVAVTGVTTANAAFQVGTGGNDTIVGLDNDNVNNTFIQPAGVTAQQHMDNTDVMFGTNGHDLLIGKLGGDTILGGPGDDTMAGGPEAFQAPNGDVLLGGPGNDINIWAPGDGSDFFAGEHGVDTMVFAPFVTKPNGDLLLRWFGGGQVPVVDTGGNPAFTCEIVKVPHTQKLGAQFLVRFLVNGNLAVTVRQRDVENLVCPSPNEGKALVASLKVAHPTFKEVHVNSFTGRLKAITAGS